jgi:hypothetical protein
MLLKKEEIDRVSEISKKVSEDVSGFSLSNNQLDSETEASLESKKNDLIEELHDSFVLKDIPRIKNTLDKLVQINIELKKVIEVEMDVLRVQKKLANGELSTVQIDLNSNKKANEIMKKIVDLVPPENRSSIVDYANDGLLGLDRIGDLLDEIKGVDGEVIESSAQIIQELEELSKRIKEQDTLVKKIEHSLSESGFAKKLRKMRHKAFQINEQLFAKLFDSTKKEIEENNKVLKDAGYYTSYIDSDKKDVFQVQWLEKKEVELSKKISLLTNQFIIPSVVFPSGNFAGFGCGKRDAMKIIKQGFVGEDEILITNRKEFVVAYQSTSLGFLEYGVNKIEQRGISKGVGFIFPLENVLKSKYFVLNESSAFVFDKPYGDDFESKVLAKSDDFDVVIKNIKEKQQEWIEEAKAVNKRFRVNWNDTAQHVIEKDFAKRWFREVVPMYPKNLAVLIMITIFKEEDIVEMNQKQLIDAVGKSKRFFHDTVGSIKRFLDNAGVRQSVSDGIFFAPSSESMFWENYFMSVGTRPHVMYYNEESLTDGVIRNWERCKANKNNASFPKTKAVKIFEKETDIEMQTL